MEAMATKKLLCEGGRDRHMSSQRHSPRHRVRGNQFNSMEVSSFCLDGVT